MVFYSRAFHLIMCVKGLHLNDSTLTPTKAESHSDDSTISPSSPPGPQSPAKCLTPPHQPSPPAEPPNPKNGSRLRRVSSLNRTRLSQSHSSGQWLQEASSMSSLATSVHIRNTWGSTGTENVAILISMPGSLERGGGRCLFPCHNALLWKPRVNAPLRSLSGRDRDVTWR